jgi:hypothetical protein
VDGKPFGFFVLIVFALMGACAHTPASAPPIARPVPRVSLRFEIDNKPFPFAVVDAKVLGEPTLALLDTGAGNHAVAGWLARKVASRNLGSSEGTRFGVQSTGRTTSDPAGHVVEVREVAEPELEIVGFGKLPSQPAMVIDLPEAFERVGVGLIVSPQFLIENDESLVLDLPKREMWREASFTKETVGPGRRFPEPKLCAGEWSRFHSILFVVPATIDGEAVELTLDTGGDATVLTSASAAAGALLSRHTTKKDWGLAAGGKVDVRTIPPVVIRVGEVERTREIPILSSAKPKTGCGPDGQLGLDVLRSCVLTLSRSRASARCADSGP